MRWIAAKAVVFDSITDEESHVDIVVDMHIIGHFYEELPDRTSITNAMGDVIFTLVMPFEKFRALYFRHLGIVMGRN